MKNTKMLVSALALAAIGSGISACTSPAALAAVQKPGDPGTTAPTSAPAVTDTGSAAGSGAGSGSPVTPGSGGSVGVSTGPGNPGQHAGFGDRFGGERVPAGVAEPDDEPASPRQPGNTAHRGQGGVSPANGVSVQDRKLHRTPGRVVDGHLVRGAGGQPEHVDLRLQVAVRSALK